VREMRLMRVEYSARQHAVGSTRAAARGERERAEQLCAQKKGQFCTVRGDSENNPQQTENPI
jgi:hypothetical protein